MRLWTLHPKYLDNQGLLALWREALLAQAALMGRTRGYANHPQLKRFRSCKDPQAAIGAYLTGVHAEGARRGFRFDAGKIERRGTQMHIATTRGQLIFEWQHLLSKLVVRDPALCLDLRRGPQPETHPLFFLSDGGVESWEKTEHAGIERFIARGGSS